MIFVSPEAKEPTKQPTQLKKKMHVCAGLSIQKSILNYCLIDFRYKKETKRKNFKDIICTGLNSHTLSK